MDLTERQVAQREIFKGRLLHVFADTVRLPDGRAGQREYVEHPGAVMIIPLIEGADGGHQVVLERQFRYPIGRVLIEFPAGKRDRGEDSLACAQRELREETGYRAREWARATLLHPAVAYSSEAIEIWFARGLEAGAPELDAGEFVEVFAATPAQVQAWCRDGSITDAKTLAGALWLQNVLDGAWALKWRAQEVESTGAART